MTWADVNVCLVWSLTFPVPTATDSRKCSDVSPLNSISGGAEQQSGGGENKQAAQRLQLLLSHWLAFRIFFKNESAGFLYAAETMHTFLLQLRSSLVWLSNLKCFLPNKKRKCHFYKIENDYKHSNIYDYLHKKKGFKRVVDFFRKILHY